MCDVICPEYHIIKLCFQVWGCCHALKTNKKFSDRLWSLGSVAYDSS